MQASHECPGGCGRQVPNRLFACSGCWSRLPRDLQRPILHTASMSLLHDARREAVADAVEFFAEPH